MFRRLEFRVGPTGWRDQTVYRRLLAWQGQIVLHTGWALLNTALLTRPPRSSGLSLSDFWAWLRYFPALADSPGLRLRPEWKAIDSHQKTILSDDWGMGFTASVVGQILDVVAWASTNHFVALAGPHRAQLKKPRARHGRRKSPDFVGLTRQGRFVVLECKGTQCGWAYSTRQMRRGRSQKKSLSLARPPLVSLVAGLFVPPPGHTERARIRVIDPPSGPATERLTPIPEDEACALVVRSSLTSALRLVNMAPAADEVASPEVGWDARLSRAARRQLEEGRPFNGGEYFGAEQTASLPEGAVALGNEFAREMNVRVLMRQHIRERLLGGSIATACEKIATEVRERAAASSGAPPLLTSAEAPSSRAVEESVYMRRRGKEYAENPLGVRLEVDWA